MKTVFRLFTAATCYSAPLLMLMQMLMHSVMLEMLVYFLIIYYTGLFFLMCPFIMQIAVSLLQTHQRSANK